MYERREHTPFPGQQHSTWQPSLRGMEKPVRSFASFMRTAPPHLGPPGNKPLPPIPSSREEQTSIAPSPLTTLDRTTNWKAPSAWDEPSPPKPDPQITSFSIPQSYELLIPEPSPSLVDSQDTSVWPFTSSSTRHSYLKPIDEQGSHNRPSSPHHSSYSSSVHIPVPENHCGFPILSSSPDAAFTTPESTIAYPVASYSAEMEILPPLPLSDVMIRTFNSIGKQNAFAPLGIESNGDKHEDLQLWSDRSKSPPASDETLATLSIRGKKLQPLDYGNLKLDERVDEAYLSEKLRQLSVSQDYHNVLADQYHEAHVYDSSSRPDNNENKGSNYATATALKASSQNPELIPRPLSWKKGPNGSSPDSSRSNLHANATPPPPEPRTRHRKRPSWVPFHQPTHSQNRSSLDEEQSRSRSNSTFEPRRDIPGAEKNRLLNKEIHLSHLIPNVKRFRSNTTGRNAPEKSSQTILPSKPFPLEQSSPLFRLPGGLAIVRQSPTAIPILQNNSFLPPFTTAQLNSYSDFPGFDIAPATRRRSSLYSQQSESLVAPAISVNKRFRSSLGSPSSSQTRSSTSSPPTSPLAYEIAIPRTPPPRPLHPPPRMPNTPPTLSYWSQNPNGKVEDRADSANEDESQKRKLRIGILGKARDVRESWKRHQKSGKHAKLKQSIRVLGPIDPGVSTAHVRRQGRILEGKDIYGGPLPGHMDGGPI